ncbi:restriction endonuclease subunit S [bacterium]|nr:restriction endonuclease subunit S [bacterium]
MKQKIPEDWVSVSLNSLFKQINRRVGTRQFPPYSISAGVGFVSQIEKWGKVIAGDQLKSYIHIKEGEFAYNKGNSKKYSCGCAYLLKSQEEICVPGVFICFSSKKASIDSGFYEQYFRANYHARELKKYISSSARADGLLNINKDDFFKIIVPFPPLHEQKQIAEILSTWDDGIEKLENLIEKKEILKTGMLQQLLTGKKRLKGFNKSLEKIRIGDYTKLGRGRVINQEEIDNNRGTFPVYSSQTSNDGIMGYINTYDFEGEYATWTTDGANAGRVFYRNGKFNCTNVCGTIRSTKLCIKFISYKLNRITKFHVSYVGNNKLMNNIMANIKVIIPSFEEQQKIASILTTTDIEIQKLREKLEKVKEQKKGLMQVLLTGKIRVVVNNEE